MRIYQRIKFDAAHRLYGYDGDCGRIHGHTWGVQVVIEGEPDKFGFVRDYRDIKNYFKLNWDHRTLLSKEDPLADVIEGCRALCGNPTAENLARIFREDLGAVSVRVWESDANWAEDRI